MLYDYQYSIMGFALTLVLLVLIYQRRSYHSRSNHVFLGLLYSNLLAIAADTVTFFTISYPERYPTWLLYASNEVYLWLFLTISLTFLLYITVLTSNNHKHTVLVRVLYASLAFINGILMITDYWTHWVFYYDENLVYTHGPLFLTLNILTIAAVSAGIVVILRAKWRLSVVQRVTALNIFLIGAGCLAIQIFYPRADIYHLVTVLVSLVIYIVFENPAYFTYHATRCLNNLAFYDMAQRIQERGQNPQMLLIGVMNRPKSRSAKASSAQTRLFDAVAERLYRAFKRNVYCAADGKFLLILPEKGRLTAASAQDKLLEVFRAPIEINEELVAAIIRCKEFRFLDMAASEDFIEYVAEDFHFIPVEQLFTEKPITAHFEEQSRYRAIEDAMLRGIQQERYFLTYQPIYEVASGSFRSAEALLSLDDPILGRVSPEAFIPIAEEDGSILRLGEMVLEMACRFLGSEQWRMSGMDFIEINVSPVQLASQGMAPRFIDIIRRTHADPKALNLEITESSLDITNPMVQENIRVLREFGLSFSIDDYGSGFASADYLYKLPVSIVKIDRTILLQAMKMEEAMMVLKDTIMMVRKLGKKVVVEGAETPAMAQAIIAAGGDYIQGFYYSRPLFPAGLASFRRGSDLRYTASSTEALP